MPYKPPSTTITFRTSKQTATKLADLANQLGATRSMLTALLLHAAITDDEILTRLRSLFHGK